MGRITEEMHIKTEGLKKKDSGFGLKMSPESFWNGLVSVGVSGAIIHLYSYRKTNVTASSSSLRRRRRGPTTGGEPSDKLLKERRTSQLKNECNCRCEFSTDNPAAGQSRSSV